MQEEKQEEKNQNNIEEIKDEKNLNNIEETKDEKNINQLEETKKEYEWEYFGTEKNRPIVTIILGMAGSGKTTLVQRINAYTHTNKIPAYFINLDPAVANIPYDPNIDIRDSIVYKDVMKEYGLGPNGGIMTTLNIFSYQFNEVMNFVDKRAPKLKYIFVDTPGQIEVFNWSASGTIITEAFCSTYPTVYIYIVDTTRSTNPVTFMSNMLYACSLLYKSRLPIIISFTKIDIISHAYAVEWMTNFESFEEALKTNTTYMGNLTQSLGFLLEEFYNNFPCVGVSSVTGEGVDDLFTAIRKAAMEYETGFKLEMDKIREERKNKEETRQKENMDRLKMDLGVVIDTKK